MESSFAYVIQIVIALISGAILGGVGHLWLKTEKLDREQARHAEKMDGFSKTVSEMKDALISLTDTIGETRDSVARIEGQLTSGFAAGAKSPLPRRGRR